MSREWDAAHEFADESQTFATRDEALLERKAYWLRHPHETRRLFVQEVEGGFELWIEPEEPTP